MIIQAQTQCFSLSLCLAYDYSNHYHYHCHRHIGVVGVKGSANRLWPRFPSLPTMPTISRSRTSRRRRRRNDVAPWRCAAAADSLPPPPPEKVRSFIIIAFVLSSCFGGWILTRWWVLFVWIWAAEGGFWFADAAPEILEGGGAVLVLRRQSPGQDAARSSLPSHSRHHRHQRRLQFPRPRLLQCPCQSVPLSHFVILVVKSETLLNFCSGFLVIFWMMMM